MTSRLKPSRARGQLGKPTRINRPVDFEGDENYDPMNDGELSRGIDKLNIDEPDPQYPTSRSSNPFAHTDTNQQIDPNQTDSKRSNGRKHRSFLDSISDENDPNLPQSESQSKFASPTSSRHETHLSSHPNRKSDRSVDMGDNDTMNDGDGGEDRQQQSRLASPSLQQSNQQPKSLASPTLSNHHYNQVQPGSLSSHKPSPHVHETAHKRPTATPQPPLQSTPTLSNHQPRSPTPSQLTPTLTNHKQQQQQQQQQQQSPSISSPSTSPNASTSEGLYRKVKINQVSYTILKVLGKGGSGKVYQAIRDDNASMCAIKEIDLSIDMNHESAISDEIALLQKLSTSPRVIKLLDQELRREVNIWYLILELGSNDFGSILQSAIQTYRQQHSIRQQQLNLPSAPIQPCGGLTYTQLCHYWEQILSCVETCHILSILHLDLKPANFVTVDGSMKLIDFGIAKAKSAEYTSVIQSNIMGTISYISPEQLSSIEQKGAKVRPSSDVWALGCIFHQMIYGYTPYSEHKQAFQRIAAISNPQAYNPPPIPTFITGGDTQLDQLLLDVLRKCLQKDPKNRPTVQELLKHPLICPHTRNTDEFKQFLQKGDSTTAPVQRIIVAMKNVMKEEMDLYKLKDSERPSTLPKDLIALLLQNGNWKHLAELLSQQLAVDGLKE